jgi:putative transcriptional regulator
MSLRIGRGWERMTRAVAALVASLMLAAALPGPGAQPDADSLAGQLLVASRAMGDPRFSETVILIVRHDETGALGIVINRPVEERSLAGLMEALGDKNSDAKGSVRIFAGGPVEPDIGFIVHSAEYHRDRTIDIDGRVAMTSDPQVLRDVGHGAGPAKLLVAFGYAGWGPGQLEAELAQHAWFTEPEDPKLVFDADRAVLWQQALDRRSRDL